MIKKILFLIFLLNLSYRCFSQYENDTCVYAEFLQPVPYNLTINQTEFNPLNAGCVYTHPNESWFYFYISKPGDIILDIQNSYGYDLDFACWGPFNSSYGYFQESLCTTSLTDNCTSCPSFSQDSTIYPSGNLVDCSYMPGPSETIHLYNAVLGQLFVLMVTNYSNYSGTFTVSQTNHGLPGAGHFNRQYVELLSVTPSACDFQTGTYSVSYTDYEKLIFTCWCPDTMMVVDSITGLHRTHHLDNWSDPHILENIPADGQIHTLWLFWDGTSSSIQYQAPLPCHCNAEAGNNISLCSGNQVTLNASGGDTINWDHGIIQNESFIPSATETYHVTVIDSFGNHCSDSVIVTVIPFIPAPIISKNWDTLFSNVSEGVQWYKMQTGIIAGAIDSVFYPTSDGDYFVIDSQSGCYSDTSNIIHYGHCSAEAGNNSTICYGDPITISATGGDNIVWDHGVTQDVSFIPFVTETYHVTIIDSVGNHCSDSVRIIVVPFIPAPTISKNWDTLYSNVSGGVQWYKMQTGIIAGATDSVFYPTSDGDYFVIDSQSGCYSDTSNIIHFGHCSAEAGNNATICYGYPITISATGGDNIVWDHGVTQDVSFIPFSSETYHVTIIDSVGNHCSDSLIVTVVPLIPTPVIIQNGDTLLANTSEGIQWYELTTGIIAGATDSIFYPATEGDYFVLCTQSGCYSDTSNIIQFIISSINSIVRKGHLMFYPNPTRQHLTIEMVGNGTLMHVKVCNLTGNEILERSFTNKITLDLLGLQKGVYIIKIIGQGINEEMKLVKQ